MNNESSIVERLATYLDLVINDVFDTFHSAHDRTKGITNLSSYCVWRSLEIADGENPRTAIIGGFSKSTVVDDLLKAFTP